MRVRSYIPTLETSDINLLIFWAKTPQGTEKDKAPEAYHPLLCPLIDVAAVAHLMWQEPKQDRIDRYRELSVPTRVGVNRRRGPSRPCG